MIIENILPKIAIVTPVFNEVSCLDMYKKAVLETFFSQNDINYEIIFVDDGSTDGSWEKILELCDHSNRFKAIRLSRNFGAHVALSAGLHYAEGDAVATLACDLQDPPQVIHEFVKKWKSGAQIVWGRRKQRSDKFWRVWASNCFQKLMQKHAMPKHSKFCTGSFFLIDKTVLECFKNFQEHNRITFALIAWTGFEQEVISYNRGLRIAGKSGWNFSMMLKTFSDAFITFSPLPAKLILSVGVLIWISSLFFGAYLIINYFLSDVMKGWTGLMLLISTLFGTLFLALGLAIEYLRRIHMEVTNRPLYFISKKINFGFLANG